MRTASRNRLKSAACTAAPDRRRQATAIHVPRMQRTTSCCAPGRNTKQQQGETSMAGTIEKKLAELGIALPTPATPVANYIPFVRTGALLFVSGQICLDASGKLVAKGKLGDGVSLEDGQKAARACAINVLAQVKAALGDLDKVKQVVRLGGFINSAPSFLDGPKVMNGASDLMVAVLGDKGRHARTTVGVAVLPGDAAVEVEGVFEVT
jgi:enamine deaminase RidA (YjgF/YER057c/UK114 family)